MEKRFKRNFGRSIRSVSHLKIYKYLTKKILSSNVEAALRYRLLKLLTLLTLLPYNSKHYCSKKAQMKLEGHLTC